MGSFLGIFFFIFFLYIWCSPFFGVLWVIAVAISFIYTDLCVELLHSSIHLFRSTLFAINVCICVFLVGLCVCAYVSISYHYFHLIVICSVRCIILSHMRFFLLLLLFAVCECVGSVYKLTKRIQQLLQQQPWQWLNKYVCTIISMFFT